ncbi:MAG: hypothetical protein IT440_11600 [Phycisphaeraceae bacterium]|nr:hypothetical protein [Phycisphaeraceae bacterium]
MPHEKIDATRLHVLPLGQRTSYIDIEREACDPDAPAADAGRAGARIDALAEHIRHARRRGASVMLTYGAHLIKNGAGPLLRRLIEHGWVTHLATQGAGVIHDWEFAYQGLSSESVRDNAPVGRFGTWDETGRWINLAVIAGAAAGLGLGESAGKLIAEQGLTLPDPEALRKQIADDPTDDLTGARADLLWTMRRFGLAGGRLSVPHPHRNRSVLACAFERHVPLTVHVGIGYDIIANHPMHHGGAIGRASLTDARIFASCVDKLSGGVYLSIGSAIMSPQVFEKAFSAANNLRQQQGKPFIQDHHMAIVDLQDGGGWDWSQGEPPKTNPAYYLRFCKTFARMGGSLDYIQCDNRVLLANLIDRLRGTDAQAGQA